MIGTNKNRIVGDLWRVHPIDARTSVIFQQSHRMEVPPQVPAHIPHEPMVESPRERRQFIFVWRDRRGRLMFGHAEEWSR